MIVKDWVEEMLHDDELFVKEKPKRQAPSRKAESTL
jgi:hypothetical protein